MRAERLPRRAPARGLLLALAAVAAVSAALASGEDRAGEAPTRPLPPLENRPAPEFAGRALDGRSIRLTDLRGKVVLLNFWGSWCPPCREEIPELVALYMEMHRRGLEVVAVDVGDPPDRARGFVHESKIPYPVLLDEGIADLYRVASFPTNVVVDPVGRIRFTAEGYGPDAIPDLRRVVQELLKGVRPGGGEAARRAAGGSRGHPSAGAAAPAARGAW